jgi:hypothetical protein
MSSIRGSVTDPGRGLELAAGGGGRSRGDEGTVQVVLDGEIYNRGRLWQLLGARRGAAAAATDADLIVGLYDRFREDFVLALEGAFAFALWDGHERLLLLGRDRFGERPLFYSPASGDGLAFATEASSLLTAGGVDARLDPDAVKRYLIHAHVPADLSIFAAVSPVAPGHMVSWRRGEEPRARRYWSPPRPTDSNAESDGDLVADLRAILAESVRSRLPDGAPVGVFMDGGLGASVLMNVASVTADASVKAFSYADPAKVEVAAIPDILASLDQPLGDPTLPALVAPDAESDVDVVLVAAGATDLLGGGAARPGGFDQPRGLDFAGEWPAGALPSLTVRSPYLTADLVEFASTVPSRLLDGSLLRGLLDSSKSDPTPSGAGPSPIAAWLRGPLASALRGQLDGAAVGEGWVHTAELAPLIDRHLAGTADESAALWPVLAFGLWLDRVRGREPGA